MKLLFVFYVLSLLFLPLAFVEYTSFYSAASPDYISYKYFHYHFSYLALPAIFFALVVRGYVDSVPFWRLVLLIATWTTVHFFVFGNAIFSELRVEMFLILLQAESLVVLVLYACKKKDIGRFIDAYFVLLFLSQILRMGLAMSTEGRFGAIGLGVGGTGYFNALYCIYLLKCRKFNSQGAILFMASLLGLVLSGQRANLLLLVLFCCSIFTGMLFRMLRKGSLSGTNAAKYEFVVCVFVLTALATAILNLLFVISALDFNAVPFLARVVHIFDDLLSGYAIDSSIHGRIESISSGVKILMENPLGLSNDFFDLQYAMQLRGYPTFPHSTLLSIMLLWSPFIALLALWWLVRLWRLLLRHHCAYHIIVLYILVSNTVWGGPYLNYAHLFVTLLFLSLANNEGKKHLHSI